MLNGTVKITNINYEAAIASLLSRISENRTRETACRSACFKNWAMIRKMCSVPF